ncbi:protein of unknown function [Cribrihabitans marinus]|uniref:DUF4153 domain-containing protein n=1 Tax=Cribrihabitans marinus TaxID=1227549 RepID=A0A1H6U4E1_9RHOB|nr:DUF4153 domain-containing protein [Cribrihabitans marinus]GGH21352.1 DUF4153 domain-containing protein [Cribrihabitans marinus]SEI83255.1 protein of unknown function [Cribrihabitans marinus]
MTRTGQDAPIRLRLALGGLGALAGLALWALGEAKGNPQLPPMLWLLSLAGLGSFAAVALALSGPLRFAVALLGGVAVAVPAALLLGWAGLRFDAADEVAGRPELLTVWMLMLFLVTPFVLVRLRGREPVTDHAALFEAAWNLTVRYGLAWLFIGLFWLVLLLSAGLLELVGVDAIERILRSDRLRFVLSGGVLGLALAVMHELRKRISPDLALRLLRLLLPVLLTVLLVFLVALPFRGLTGLFGGVSPAATLMGTVAAAITLVSAALDRDEANAVATSGLRGATRVLAVILPVPAALAVWAIALRVHAHGWTPDRLLAALAAGVLLAYALSYAACALSGRRWTGRIRTCNVALAGVSILLAALWLTPALDAFRISAASQLARHQTGGTDGTDLPLWHMAHDWGRAGRAGLDRLATGADLALAKRIAEARNTPSRSSYESAAEDDSVQQDAAELVEVMPVRPQGASFAGRDLDQVPPFYVRQWLDGCRRQLSDGRPGCVLVRGNFRPGIPAAQQAMVLFLDSGQRVRATYLRHRPDGDPDLRAVFDPQEGSVPDLPAGALAQVLDGESDVVPSGVRALGVGGAVLMPGF